MARPLNGGRPCVASDVPARRSCCVANAGLRFISPAGTPRPELATSWSGATGKRGCLRGWRVEREFGASEPRPRRSGWSGRGCAAHCVRASRLRPTGRTLRSSALSWVPDPTEIGARPRRWSIPHAVKRGDSGRVPNHRPRRASEAMRRPGTARVRGAVCPQPKSSAGPRPQSNGSAARARPPQSRPDRRPGAEPFGGGCAVPRTT